jgi:hypothetical protein
MSALGRNLTLPFDFYNTIQVAPAMQRNRRSIHPAISGIFLTNQLLQLHNR